MTGSVKSLMFAGFAAGSVALASQQEPPRPPQPPQPPAPGMPGGVTVTRDGNRMIVTGQGGGFGISGGPGGIAFGGPGGPGGPEGGMMFARSFGDDPKSRELAKKLADAKDDETKEKLRGELKAALAKAFDERLKGQEKQVEELEKQLKRLKEMVGKRKEAKTDIIADRMTALEKEAKGLGW